MKCEGGVCPPLDDGDQQGQENPDDQASMNGLLEEEDSDFFSVFRNSAQWSSTRSFCSTKYLTFSLPRLVS